MHKIFVLLGLNRTDVKADATTCLKVTRTTLPPKNSIPTAMQCSCSAVSLHFSEVHELCGAEQHNANIWPDIRQELKDNENCVLPLTGNERLKNVRENGMTDEQPTIDSGVTTLKGTKRMTVETVRCTNLKDPGRRVATQAEP